MSYKAASVKHGIPKSTLYDHAKGRYKGYATNFGPDKCMSETDEQSLANYLAFMSERGFPLTRKVIKTFASEIVKRSGNPRNMNLVTGPSDHWICGFLNRHDHLRTRTPHSIDIGYQSVPQSYIDEYELLDKELKIGRECSLGLVLKSFYFSLRRVYILLIIIQDVVISILSENILVVQN